MCRIHWIILLYNLVSTCSDLIEILTVMNTIWYLFRTVRALLLKMKFWFWLNLTSASFTAYCFPHSSFRQQIRIQQLGDENSSLKERLQTADDTIERQMKQIENLTLQLGEAERNLAEKEEDMESLDKSSKDEVI